MPQCRTSHFPSQSKAASLCRSRVDFADAAMADIARAGLEPADVIRFWGKK